MRCGVLGRLPSPGNTRIHDETQGLQLLLSRGARWFGLLNFLWFFKCKEWLIL